MCLLWLQSELFQQLFLYTFATLPASYSVGFVVLGWILYEKIYVDKFHNHAHRDYPATLSCILGCKNVSLLKAQANTNDTTLKNSLQVFHHLLPAYDSFTIQSLENALLFLLSAVNHLCLHTNPSIQNEIVLSKCFLFFFNFCPSLLVINWSYVWLHHMRVTWSHDSHMTVTWVTWVTRVTWSHDSHMITWQSHESHDHMTVTWVTWVTRVTWQSHDLIPTCRLAKALCPSPYTPAYLTMSSKVSCRAENNTEDHRQVPPIVSPIEREQEKNVSSICAQSHHYMGN